MKKSCLFVFLEIALLFVLTASGFTKDEIEKKELNSEGKSRTYYLFVPKSANAKNPAPLIVMLHGSGRNGRILLEHWQELAEREGIILAGPDSQNSASWAIPADGPQFIFDLIEELKSKYPVNPQRIYLFGHSAGAIFGIYLSLLESNYFAATAVSAGALQSKSFGLFDDSERKIPVALFVGTQDPLFPLSVVRETRDAFAKREFVVELTEIKGLNHNYYSRSKEINEKAWDFLKKYQLESEQKYKKYQFKNE